MKIFPFLAWFFLTFSGALLAAPRLVVSTPSLLPESEIDIVFEQPMVAQEDLGKETGNDLVSISPALPGKLFWKAPTIAQFKPDGIAAIGTEYVFIAKKGLKHLDGSVVEAGEFAKVSSEAFRIHTSRIQNRYSGSYSPATATWMIIFNDDVDLASIAGFFSFSSEKNQRVAPDVKYATAGQAGYMRTNYLTWANRSDPEKQKADMPAETLVKNIVYVSPNSPLPVAKKWELRVLKGLSNAGKTATLIQDASYRIGAVEPFRYERASAEVSVDTPRSISVRFNRPLPGNFDPALLSVSPAPKSMAVESEGRYLNITGDFSEQDNYVLSLAKGIVSAENQNLSNPSGNISLQFERLAAELGLPSENEAQLAHGQRKYAISTVNLSKVNIRIKALSGKGMVRAYQGYRSYSGRGPNYSQVEPVSVIPYSLIPGQTIVEKEIELGTSVDSGKILELSWGELLPEGLEYASLFIDVIGTPHKQADAHGRRNAQAIIQLTDIGLAWKFTDDSALVFAFSCDTGKPLPGVKIGIYGEDADRMEEVATDENGMATVSRNEKVRHLNAVHGKDSYTIAFDETLDQVGMWHFPVRHSWMKQLPEKRRAFLYTERSLYRPGETVRIKGIVRDQLGNSIALSKNASARIVIVDPKDKEIFTQPVEISGLGSFDLTYTLPAETTGEHTIKLEFPDDLEIAEKTEDWEEQIALEQSASFSIALNVEEFRRNTYEVVQKIDPTVIGAEEVSVQLAATYYQGQPVAAGQAVTFTEVTDSNPYPERYRDFLFGNHKVDDWRYWYNYFGYRDRDGDNDVTSTSFNSDQVLSKDGLAEIPVVLPKSDFPTTREISVSTEVTDANNQTLTARSTATVHPAALYAGVSRVDRLIRVGDETPFRLVVTDTEGNPATEDITLTATVTRQVHTTTKTTNVNGDTVTESDPHEEAVSTVEVVVPADASAKEGLPFPIVPANTGLHYLTLKGTDAEGREFATVTRFHAYGAKEYPWRYEDGMRIKLVSEKKSYKPGDTARVLVLSPIEGTALVTIEREKILTSYITELKADNPVIEIPITDDYAPNAFVSILIVKGSSQSAREIKAPQLRLGYCELTVVNKRDRLAVEITKPAESYRPGTEVALAGSVASADGKPAAGAEVTLYAVDEGTLAVMGYDTPDPMGYFYDPRLLSMQQSDGSFGYWPGATETNEWVTPYAGMALTLASQNGGSVPPSALEILSQYLIKSLRGAGEAKTSRELENHARSLYTLALLGKAQPPYHALMTEKLPFMSGSARGLLAAAMAVSSEGRPKVLSVAKSVLESKVKYRTLENGGYWSPGNSSSATDLIALLAIDPDSADTHKALDIILNDRNPYGHWRSTWVNGWSLLAISQYASHQSLSDEPIQVSFESNEGLQEIRLTKETPTAALSMPLTPATVMSLKASASAYVRIKVAAKPAIAPIVPVAMNGLSIDRFYEKVLNSGQTEVLTQPALGDLIRVTLRVTLPKDDTRYLVVDDPLPAIFETVNSDFASQSSGQNVRTSEKDWTISHSELRSDRAVFFMDHVWRKGTYEITYLARCTVAGEVTAPPAKVESMYDPENFALSASQKFK